jgi:hypothetical protein
MEIEKCSNWRPFGITLLSADDEYCEDAARIVLYAFGRRVEWRIPQVVQPYRVRHAANWDAATVERMGRDWWEEVFPCEYGFRLSEGFLQVFLGPQTHDSLTTKSWCKHLPWTQWRHVRFSLYDLKGNHVWSHFDKDRKRGINSFYEQRAAQEACPKAVFSFDDYDGKRIQATTHIQEREWRFGEGWFKWLSLFRRPMVKRSLDLRFSDEIGPEKGSWKGGTVGHSIDMLPSESPEAAFQRYCEQEHRAKYGTYRLTYVGQA